MYFAPLYLINIVALASIVIAAPLKNTMIFPSKDHTMSQGDDVNGHGLAIVPDGEVVLKAGTRPEETCGRSACLQVMQAEVYPWFEFYWS